MADHIRFWRLTQLGGTFHIDDTPADRLDWLLRLDSACNQVRNEKKGPGRG